MISRRLEKQKKKKEKETVKAPVITSSNNNMEQMEYISYKIQCIKDTGENIDA